VLWIKNVNENKPFYATMESVGFDIFSTEDAVLLPGCGAILGTGLFIAEHQDWRSTLPRIEAGGIAHELIPELQIRSKSGLAAKYGVVVLNSPCTVETDLAAKYGVVVLNSPGTVETDYPDEIKVILHNHGKTAFSVHVGNKIAQGVVALTVRASNVQVKNIIRTGGFGSTGDKA
jgi:dUTPase